MTNPTLPEIYRSAAALMLPLLLAGFLALLALVSKRIWVQERVGRITRRIGFLQKLRVAELLDHFLDGLAPLARLDLLLQALFWTGVSWAISLLAGYILMFSVYETVSWSATALYIAAGAFAIAVPAVPGNIGTYEWAVMLAVSASGYGEAMDAVNVSFGLIVHAVNLLVFALMGSLGFIHEGISLSQLRSSVQDAEDHTAVKQERYVSERT
jgi:uncharacterized membrane protein YbhN (UPF0104 family)